MNRSTLFWIIAFVITIVTAYYQRTTGPTYPLTGSVVLDGKSIAYKLERSHGGESNAAVDVRTDDAAMRGTLEWKRFKTSDAWSEVPMAFNSGTGTLSAELPHQPPAGKLEYRVRLDSPGGSVILPTEGSTVVRFKGDVPAPVIIPHIIAMFLGMLLSARAALACFEPGGRVKHLTYGTVFALLVGGMILGPFVQHYAFDAWWTGWPVATDLTDNKTAIAFLAWVVAMVMVQKSQNSRPWVIGAAIVTFVVFLIPHSMFGSELKYEDAPKTEQSNPSR